MRVMFKTASKAISKFFKKHGTKILVAGACAGTIGAVVEGVRVTPKAMKKIEEATIEKGEELTLLEKVKTAGPLYLPCGIMALESVACAIGCEVVHKKKEVALIGTLTATKAAYDEYRQITKDLKMVDSETGEEVSVEQKIRDGLAKKHIDEEDVPDYKIYGDYSEGLYKCRDSVTGQYFWSNQMRIENVCSELNKTLESGKDDKIPYGTFLRDVDGEDCEANIGFMLNSTGRLEPKFGTCRDKEGRPCLELGWGVDPDTLNDYFY